MNKIAGKNGRRVDGIEKVTGKALYTGDLRLPGLAYAKLLRSPVAHARLTKVDASRAKQITGVIATLTRDDIKDFNYKYGATYKDQCIVAVDKVRYVGDPIAAVLADDPAVAAVALGDPFADPRAGHRAQRPPAARLAAAHDRAKEICEIDVATNRAIGEHGLPLFQAAFEKAGPEMYQKNAALVTEGMAAISHSHSVLAEFEPELSFGKAPDAAQVTRWRVMQFQVRPGTGQQFEDLIKEVKELHSRANDGVPVMVYRLVDGAQAGFHPAGRAFVVQRVPVAHAR